MKVFPRDIEGMENGDPIDSYVLLFTQQGGDWAG